MHGTIPGYYGKLPSFGDFLTRRLPRQFVEPWDTWLRNVLSCSTEQLADGWMDSYLTSPIWRFALTANVLSEAAWAGVLMPSVDQVGRYFPFTVAAPFAATWAPLRLAEAAKTWFERLDEIALSALDDGFDLETLDTQLEELGGPIDHETAPTTAAAAAVRSPDRRLAIRCDLGPSVDFSVVLPELTTRVVRLVAPAHGIWWSWGSDMPFCLACMPTASSSAPTLSAYPSRAWLPRASGGPRDDSRVCRRSLATS